jgi:hypothetical protein
MAMKIRPDDQLGFRGLTVRQPFASEIASGEATIEYRTWGTDYRGDLLITASANETREEREEREARKMPVPLLGCAICIVEIVDCVEADGEFHWVMENPRPLPPVRTVGAQLIWKVPTALVSALELEL